MLTVLHCNQFHFACQTSGSRCSSELNSQCGFKMCWKDILANGTLCLIQCKARVSPQGDTPPRSCPLHLLLSSVWKCWSQACFLMFVRIIYICYAIRCWCCLDPTLPSGTFPGIFEPARPAQPLQLPTVESLDEAPVNNSARLHRSFSRAITGCALLLPSLHVCPPSVCVQTNTEDGEGCHQKWPKASRGDFLCVRGKMQG